MIIVTGASNNHYLSLINLIDSFLEKNTKNNLIVYNLGLDNDKWNFIQEKYKNAVFLYKIFDYTKYPSWFNINIEAGQYAWKPTIIYNTFIEFPESIIVWMDAGNLINDLDVLEDFIVKNHIYSTNSSGDIKKWTHPDTIQYLNCLDINAENRNAACIGLNTKIDFVKELITEFYNCAQDKNCIAPEGSSRKNHRQDQAVFTILFYKYLNDKNVEYYNGDWKYHLGYSIHNDVDPDMEDVKPIIHMDSNNVFYNKYQKNVFSQNGEDGIIEELLSRLAIKDGWVCEFGAWDGIHFSNTFNLIKNKDFSGVFIEGDSTKFIDLLNTQKQYNKIVAINEYVDHDITSNNSLDNILKRTQIPIDFDILSIDIDSFDYQVWDSLINYTPKIVIIEINSSINPNIPNHIHNPGLYEGTSFNPMLNLAIKKGYTFILHTGNMIFIRNDLFNILNIEITNPLQNFRNDWLLE
jgi:hypothetical protein